jgi:hypothetical protein
MGEERGEEHGWPAEPDDTIIADLVGGIIAKERADAGRRMLVRVYCRKLNIRLLESQPMVVDPKNVAVELSGVALVPLVDIVELQSHATPFSDRVIVVPQAWADEPLVACCVSDTTEIFAPFMFPGDTILIALARARWSPAALLIRHESGRPTVTDDASTRDIIGTVVALWPGSTG